jgi:ligand-binding SRPBCC domain-containing protein
MKVYHLQQKQFLPITLGEAWDFFSSPANLVKITPDHMDFKILHISGHGSGLYPGQIISYKVKILPMIYVRWVTEISHVQHPHYFIDEQRFGPFSMWHHEHRFKEVNGGVEMTDEITYAAPLGILGRIANLIFVKRQLDTIFRFRYNFLEREFSKNDYLKRSA